MAAIESGRDKIRQICAVLRQETLDPAIKEGEEIVSKARRKAEDIVRSAQQEAQTLRRNVDAEIQRKQTSFSSSLRQASQQTLEQLRQSIEKELFVPELQQLIIDHLQSADVIAQLINAVIEGILREGISGHISAFVAESVSPRQVNALLAAQVKERLREKGVLLKGIAAGAEVKIWQDHLTIDVSAAAISEMVWRSIRHDFRDFVFAAQAARKDR